MISKITYATVTWWDRMDIALARSLPERLQRAVCVMITGAMRTTSTKVLEMFLDLLTLGMAVELAALMVAYRLPEPNPKNLEIVYNRIWAKADKVDSKFSMIKDYITPIKCIHTCDYNILRRLTIRKYECEILIHVAQCCLYTAMEALNTRLIVPKTQGHN